jgi:hypothetical protein
MYDTQHNSTEYGVKVLLSWVLQYRVSDGSNFDNFSA